MPVACLVIFEGGDSDYITFDLENFANISDSVAKDLENRIPAEHLVTTSISLSFDSRISGPGSLPGFFARAATILLLKSMER